LAARDKKQREAIEAWMETTNWTAYRSISSVAKAPPLSTLFSARKPAHMLIATGATSVTVSESLAQELLLRGEAIEAPSAQVTFADGSTRIERNI
jgi:hypothetical protein